MSQVKAITVEPEHVEGLRYLLETHWEMACEARDPEQIRELLELGDQVGWRATTPAVTEGSMSVSPDLLDKLAKYAWSAGNEIMADVYTSRAGNGGGSVNPELDERQAKSMLAFCQHVQAEAVA